MPPLIALDATHVKLGEDQSESDAHLFSRLVSFSAAFVLSVGFNPAPISAQSSSGSYLAAKQAEAAMDFRSAADFYLDVIFYDESHLPSQRGAVHALLAAGDMISAGEIAQGMIDSREADAAGLLSYIGLSVLDGDFEKIIDLLEEPDISVNVLTDGLTLAWAYLGVGEAEKALELFDEVSSQNGLAAFSLYHKALALAWMGDFEGANAVFDEVAYQGGQSRRLALPHASVLSQLGQNEDAIELLGLVFGSEADPEVSQSLKMLDSGEKLAFTAVRTPSEGIAEVFYTVAEALSGEFADIATLYYARLAQALRPEDTDAQILTAEILEKLGRLDLAQDVYAGISEGSHQYFTAAIGTAEALRSSGDLGAAVVQLTALLPAYSDRPILLITLGDVYRQMKNYEKAIDAYTGAIDLMGQDDPQLWYTYYVRGISYERTKQWSLSEADFRSSLELQPNQPQVLNDLGYSLVERREKLDEALNMIQRAVSVRPSNGYIVDSLGWVLYRLGRFEEAVEPMERAAELMATDPIVNDHLGDVYWMVGRYHEARFQWHRALSFDPDEVDADRIRRKLDLGLDVVLAEEAADD